MIEFREVLSSTGALQYDSYKMEQIQLYKMWQRANFKLHIFSFTFKIREDEMVFTIDFFARKIVSA